jgi:excisionase family DNA binding protein
MSNDHATLKPEDVAAHFGVEPVTVLDWVKQGKLTALKLSGKVIRFRESDVARFIERSETRAAATARG